MTYLNIQFRKNKAYPTLPSIIAAMWYTVYYTIRNRGRLVVAFDYPRESLYVIGDNDQSDVLKLCGFKTLRRVTVPGQGYKVSRTEKILGFRRKKATDPYMETGIHERIEGVRQKFKPHKQYPHGELCPYIIPYKWPMVPIPPYFGGFDNNGNGLGGKAPRDIKVSIIFLKHMR